MKNAAPKSAIPRIRDAIMLLCVIEKSKEIDIHKTNERAIRDKIL